MKIYFLIPVFNEELNVELLSENIKNTMPGYDKKFVFVDDCSTDSTIECLKKCFLDCDFILIKKEMNYGPGHSFNLGFDWILTDSKDSEDVIVTMEADNTSEVEILSKMIAISKLGYEMVLASVYVQGGRFSKTNLFRVIISFFANQMFRLLFNVKVLTISSFYRVYDISLVKRIKLNYETIIQEKGFISMLEILLKAIKVDAHIIEVPMVLHSNRRSGKSKIKKIKTTLSYLRFLFFGRKIYYNGK